MTKKKIPALNVETVDSRVTLHFVSLLEYRRETYLCIINNITSSEIGAYVLDYAEQERVPINHLLSLTTRWFYGKSDQHPLSLTISSLGLTERIAPIYRTFDTSFVSRIVGHAFSYGALEKSKVKRRRVVPLPMGVEIKLRKSGHTPEEAPSPSTSQS